MKEDRQLSQSLFCFTPLVSLGTFGIETILAIYIFYRYRSKMGRVTGFFFILLGLFQLNEFILCRVAPNLHLAKVSFVIIAFLPFIGLYGIKMLCHKVRFVWLAFGLAVILSVLMFIVPASINGVSCPGNYVIFDFQPLYGPLYGLYYGVFIALGIFYIMRDLYRKHSDAILMRWLLVVYAVFIIPTFTIHIFLPATILGHASILCGFAILAAIIFTWKVLPRYHELRNKHGIKKYP